MARLTGSNKYYMQAIKTAMHLYDVEVKIDGALLGAIDTLINLSSDSSVAAATRMAAAKFIIETHSKIAKNHGKNIKPDDFTELSTSYKNTGESKVEPDEDSDNIISMNIIAQ